jgi:hypothetical protein
MKASSNSVVDSSEVDTFVFRIDPPPFDVNLIPPFVMGGYKWNNWLIGWLNKVCDTVTFGLDPPIYSVNPSEYRIDNTDLKFIVNKHLASVNRKYFGSNNDTKWKIAGGQIVSRYGGAKLKL